MQVASPPTAPVVVTEGRASSSTASRPSAARSSTDAALRVLAITRIFPNAVEPLSSTFNRQQFAALGRLCQLEVMATIPWFPGASLVKGSKAGALRQVPARDVIEALAVTHPRVVYVPGLPGVSGALEIASLLPSFLPRCRKVDVVLGSWAYPDGAAAVALGKLANLPVVVKAHGSDLNVQGAMLGPRTNLALALPRASRVVAVSAALCDRAVALGAPRERVVVIPNGTDASLFHVRDRDATRAGLGWPGGWPARVVLYCGRIERAKGALDLLDAFARIAPRAPDLGLALLGDGSAMADAKAKAAALGARVHFLGARPLAEVPLWMGACDLLTLPSHAEGSPNVVREALASGRPVVGTNVGGIPELIGGRDAGDVGALVPAKDPAALGEALLDVAGRTYDARKIAARSGVSWDDSARALLSVLATARAEHAAGAVA